MEENTPQHHPYVEEYEDSELSEVSDSLRDTDDTSMSDFGPESETEDTHISEDQTTYLDEFTRDIQGVRCFFNKYGQVVKTCLPGDLTTVKIENLPPQWSLNDARHYLDSHGVDLDFQDLHLDDISVKSLTLTFTTRTSEIAQQVCDSIRYMPGGYRGSIVGEFMSVEAECRTVRIDWRSSRVSAGRINEKDNQNSDSLIAESLRHDLERSGPLTKANVEYNLEGNTCAMTSRFKHEADAVFACTKYSWILSKAYRDHVLAVVPIFQVKITVPSKIYIALRQELKEDFDRCKWDTDLWDDPHIRCEVQSGIGSHFTSLVISGSVMQRITYVVTSLLEILKGKKLYDEDQYCWFPTLFSPATLKKLEALERFSQVAIVVDKVKRQVSMYGAPERVQALCYELTDIIRSKVRVKPAKKVSRRAESPVVSDDGIIGGCPVCYSKLHMPYAYATRVCPRHTICLDCFEVYCRYQVSDKNEVAPIRCPGNGGNCNTMFTLDVMKKHMAAPALESNLETSFAKYMDTINPYDQFQQRHTGSLQPCPCGKHWFRIDSESTEPSDATRPRVQTCPSCLITICTKCRYYHPNTSCEANNKDEVLTKTECIEDLLKDGHDAKICPKCSVVIEKVENDSRMACPECKINFCWICVAILPNSEACDEHVSFVHEEIEEVPGDGDSL
ncbi:hypothetical protein BT63DRAFT_471360 [Microthyrium microscopicum]|uniref:RING-type domain-containing protein n=1 Tax=Microthyrium microscopicum TaxID=703497 RepID=A0A6A6U7N7_9PEZI|nr:hypothetical protein BT63DRAFT_471360 [Microthyrium microscopicum]